MQTRCKNTTIFDSATLCQIKFSDYKKMENNKGTFVIKNVQEEVKDIFNITGLGSILNIEN